MTRTIHSRRSRGAYTMMELLIVVSIMIILAAITLPVAKQVLNDSHLREASRQLSAYFAMAKARAVHTGRPCGIQFVCLPPLGNATGIRAVTQLYLAEVPPPYRGDVEGTTGAVNLNLTNNQPNPLYGPWPLSLDTQNMNYAASASTLILPGERFEIQFNYKGPWFVAYRDMSGSYFVAGPPGPDGAWGVKSVDDNNNGTPDDISEYLWPGSDDVGVLAYNSAGVLTPALPVYPPTQPSFYGIRRAPHRIGNPLELPAGSCVDMEYSGMGQTGADFSFLKNGGNRLDLLGVLFSPQGNVDALYTITSNGVATSLNGPIAPSGTLHFLIGKIEKMNLPNGLTDDTNRNPSNVHLFDRTEANLADPTSLWVSVGRSGGGVTTAENDPPPIGYSGSPPTSVVAFPAEQGMTGGRYQVLCPTSPSLAQFASAQSIFLGYSRTIANNREQMRGR